MAETVGVIGLGIMGRPMARNILRAGFPLAVWNRTASKMEDLVREGAVAASSPRDLASRASVVITIVADSPDVEQVILGPEGVIEGVTAGSVVIDMSTISPATARRVAERLGQRGIHMLDAPVSGGQSGAENGALSIMVGGEAEALERCRPVLEAVGRRIVHCGPSGAGQVAKAVNQIIVTATLAGVAEGLVFAAKAGADLEAVYEAVTGGAARSWQLENLGRRILDGDFSPGFTVRNQVKDLNIVQETLREMGLPLLVAPLVHQVYRAAAQAGHGEEGTQAYIKVLEDLAGVVARGRRH